MDQFITLCLNRWLSRLERNCRKYVIACVIFDLTQDLDYWHDTGILYYASQRRHLAFGSISLGFLLNKDIRWSNDGGVLRARSLFEVKDVTFSRRTQIEEETERRRQIREYELQLYKQEQERQKRWNRQKLKI